MKSKYEEMFDELTASDELKHATFKKLIQQSSKMSSNAAKIYAVLNSNKEENKMEQTNVIKQKMSRGGKLAIWLSTTAAALAVIIAAVIIIPGLLIGGLTIRPLEDYKATIDGYLSSIKESDIQSYSVMSTSSMKAASMPTLDDYNFKLETNTKATYHFETDYSFDMKGEGIFDGKKVKLTTASESDEEIIYLDGDKHYFEVDDNWYYKYEDSSEGIELIVSMYNDFLNPDLYDKTETKTEHIYTLKQDAVVPIPKIYEGLDLSYIDLKIDIVLKINADFLLFNITSTVTYLDSIFVGYKVISEGTQKITLGGQTVMLPDGAIKFEDPEEFYGPAVTAVGGDKFVTLTWEKPNGLLSGYSLMYYSGTGEDVKTIENISADATAYTVTGLNNRTEYTFRLFTAYARIGVIASDSVTATPVE